MTATFAAWLSESMDQIKAVMRTSRQSAAGNPTPSIEELRSGMDQMLATLPPASGGRIQLVDAGGCPPNGRFPTTAARPRAHGSKRQAVPCFC